MKNIFFTTFLLFIVSSCSQSDKEQMLGSWKGDRIYRDGKLLCSFNRNEQQEIVNRQYKKEKEVLEKMQLSRYDYEQNMIRSMEKMLQMQLNFTANDTLYMKTDDSPYIGDPWVFRVVEDSNVLVLEDPSRRVRYLYKVERNKLVLKNENMRLEFVRNN